MWTKDFKSLIKCAHHSPYALIQVSLKGGNAPFEWPRPQADKNWLETPNINTPTYLHFITTQNHLYLPS
ncbi:hypothetical protein L1987_77251 [Smallanthus sonchifolius]|uniref:Uncharacterized protein n=1 Tax=Smallanthus sonchifolius TaxID=185202 RepID=A0ACB8Z9M7_9ASTR|nr:hypothetical protein L1987_77251 [Smallanthus sonchifolius]